MDFGDISEVLRSATDLLDTTGDFLRFVREAKAQWRHARTGESHSAALRPALAMAAVRLVTQRRRYARERTASVDPIRT